jgi:outer membrane PBP1 activator LpoA protein
MLDGTIANHSIYQAVKNLWKENFSQYSRLYALGIDAYKLSNQMPQLLYMPEVGISGMTGILKIDHNNIIYRKLMWGTFENGLAVVLNQKN